MNPAGAFRVGVNYWPSRAALGWWEDFDPGVVQADFARIADAGLDSVRFFCTWEAFQPEPGHVSETMLDQLLVVADLAAAARLSAALSKRLSPSSGTT